MAKFVQGDENTILHNISITKKKSMKSRKNCHQRLRNKTTKVKQTSKLMLEEGKYALTFIW
jgi:hypothetical protein